MYYRYMDPHPQSFNHQGPPNSYPCQHYPFWEAVPPRTNINSQNHPSGFGHLPCPNPAEHGGCCNYGYPPGYNSFRPPYSYMPPPFYYHTPYPPHPDAYPAYYVPPPHYSLDQPRYDYDKARHHCCGCPNHTCPQKDGRYVKVEEQEPEKESKRESSSLVQSPNHNFPIFWVPPEYMKGKENFNGWVPLDINSLKGTRQEGEEKKQPPSPVVWMPTNDEPKEASKDVKEINPAPKTVEDWPSKFKIIPLKFLENGGQDKKPRIVEDEAMAGGQPETPAEKESRIKTIPVKHLEERNEKISTTEKPKVKQANKVEKASEKKQTSPVKSSKLPPVCLRVDPLPRRKTTNGKSRSPSPPGLGERAQQRNEGRISQESTQEIAKKKNILASDMKDKTASQQAKEKKCQDNVQAKQEVTDLSEHATTEQRSEFMEGKCPKAEQKTEVDEGRNVKEEKERSMSESDAAVIIQSAYRGFEVRRWQPLEKLQKIAKIREQMGNIRRQIEGTEGFTTGKDAKQKVVISETIMNLLLQLDTIQGLHPAVREARKAVARELVRLQEKLDAVCSLVTEDHESMKAKTSVSDENTDHHSCLETKSTTKKESLDGLVASVGCTGTSEGAKVEDPSPDAEVVLKQTTEQGSKQLRELDGDVEHPPFEGEESNRSADEGVAIIASSSLVTTQEPEEKLQIATGNGSPAEPILNDEEAGCCQEVDEEKMHESTRSADGVAIIASPSLVTTQEPEEKFQIATGNGSPDEPILNDKEAGCCQQVDEEKVHIEADANGFPEQQILQNNEAESCQKVDEGKRAEEIEAVEAAAEESHVAEAPIISGPTSNKPFQEEGSSNASACEENLIPDKQGPCLEVNSQKLTEAEQEMVESGGSEDRNIISESEELLLQSSGEESNIPEATSVRVEEAKLDAEGCLLVAPAEEKIDHVVDGNREMKIDDHTEEELQVLSMAEGDSQIEMSTKPEEVADVNSCPEEAIDSSMNILTVVDNSNMLVGEYCANPPEREPEIVGGDGSPVACKGNEDPNSVMSHNDVGVAATSPIVADDMSLPGVLEATTDAIEAPVLKDGGMSAEEKKLIEENDKLREMLEKLLEAGKEQLGVISSLNGKVKELERKVAQKKRVKVKRNRKANKHRPCVASC